MRPTARHRGRDFRQPQFMSVAQGCSAFRRAVNGVHARDADFTPRWIPDIEGICGDSCGDRSWSTLRRRVRLCRGSVEKTMNGRVSDDEIRPLLAMAESEELEFKGSVPPRSVMAQQISAFANTSGGWLIIGVGERNGKHSLVGVSADSLAPVITEAALASVQPRPAVRHGLVEINGLLVYAIRIEKSQTRVAADHDVVFERKATRTVPLGVSTPPLGVKGGPRYLAHLFDIIRSRDPGTASMSRLARQYDSLAVIAAENGDSVCGRGSGRSSTFHHGRALLRLLFSSV
jgi:hypothetical protein